VFEYGKLQHTSCSLNITLGSHGEKFYIILDGQVSVLVPQNKDIKLPPKVNHSQNNENTTFLTNGGGNSFSSKKTAKTLSTLTILDMLQKEMTNKS
jgi:hypothetical protein